MSADLVSGKVVRHLVGGAEVHGRVPWAIKRKQESPANLREQAHEGQWSARLRCVGCIPCTTHHGRPQCATPVPPPLSLASRALTPEFRPSSSRTTVDSTCRHFLHRNQRHDRLIGQAGGTRTELKQAMAQSFLCPPAHRGRVRTEFANPSGQAIFTDYLKKFCAKNIEFVLLSLRDENVRVDVHLLKVVRIRPKRDVKCLPPGRQVALLPLAKELCQ